MAISKERLEELIKEREIIYCLEDGIIWLIYLGKNYNVGQTYFGNIERSEYWLYYQNDIYKPLNKLYETQKQAEWALKYHATRTEELDLPMWEEFIKEDNTVVKFWKNGHKITLYKYIKNKKTNNIRIMILDDREDCECWKFNEPATEENYEKACNVALKLFMGENNDKRTIRRVN